MGVIQSKNFIVGETKLEEPKPTPQELEVKIKKVFEEPQVQFAKDDTILRKKFKKEKEHGLLFHHGEKSPYHIDMLTKENE